MTKVLFVCLGNICRSPAGEAVLKSMVSEDDFFIDSAGTNGLHDGERADARMRAAAKKRGIDITSISRQVTAQDLEEFDYILTMDDSNYGNTIRLNSDLAHKVHKFSHYFTGEYQKFTYVPDPYWGGDDGFELVLDLLTSGCQEFLKRQKLV